MATDSCSWSTVQTFLDKCDDQTSRCFHQTQWDKLCQIASGLAGHSECIALGRVASGLNNVARLLEFPNKSCWVARAHIRRNECPRLSSTKLAAEVATMQYIKEHSNLPLPRVFAYEADEDNLVGVSFILMELLPGIVAMDALGGYEVHRGVIPREYRQNFYRSVAKCHVQLTSIRLPQIGTIVRTREGGYECGPIPGIGGPFDTATAFFETWAKKVKFQWDRETIIRMMRMQNAPISAEQMVEMIEEFPLQIQAIASRLSLYDTGPFPLAHVDFFHSNIMVDGNFDVTGIIDWERACTVPWELIAFPAFLRAMPVSFDLPEHYDHHGQPLDNDLREVWRGRKDYVDMVRSMECADSLLSTCLSSKRGQAIAYVYEAYSHNGKFGFYDRVMEELESLPPNINKMRLSLAATALSLLALPLQSLAATGYCCQSKGGTKCVAPTYDCGVSCGLSGYNTDLPGHHYWVDGFGAGRCYKTCCARKGKVVVQYHNV
ncbi:kinase-like domain-containing protein [Aspergillus karnatakaensis]|uniref:phosphotransferase family protein n=1 Tax=Aspergillus karnatakaensis TaxID=1810916 RepID=UPI003CCC9DCD